VGPIFPCYRNAFHPTTGSTDCPIYTSRSRQDLCNFRLVCRKLHDSSVQSLGRLLGGGVFCITKVGLDDLQAIASLTALGPHIKTLTFGYARFDDPNRTPHSEFEGSFARTWRSLPDTHRDRLLSAYTEAYQWSYHNNASQHIRLLSRVFKCFPNLHDIRLHPSDSPGKHNHLVDGLRPGDAEVFNKAWQTETLSRKELEGGMYGSHIREPQILGPISRAAKSAGIIIEELRISYGWVILPSKFTDAEQMYDMFSNVRKLQLPLQPNYLSFDNTTPAPQNYREVFYLFPNVTHLWLSTGIGFPAGYYTKETTNLFTLLKPLARLESLCLHRVTTCMGMVL
jgi:hypothetical protein